MTKTEVRYQVECMNCGQVFEPVVKSPLWWKAKKRDEQGYLDALHISGEECGCVAKQHHPDAPFRVFGYDDMCADYNIPCDTFVEAVRTFRRLSKEGDVVFITGVSVAVEDKLRYPW